MSHTTRICPLPASEKTFKFGVCTECQGHGHIADQCPNRNPDDHPTLDGVCQFCGSNYHVLRKCPERLKELKKMDDKPITLGKITADQGGDDDDVFLEMRQKELERLRPKTQPKPAPKKAKVVTF
ncbi:hypothetical protein H4R35_002310 [Dimargaris xerosporica]|nr:hypothetical protein H4R35_002310 [Dimargaris xerosporica]